MLVATLRPCYEVEPEKRLYFERTDESTYESEEREAYLVIKKTG